MSQSAADDRGPVLSRTAFIVAWTAAAFVPWITTTLLWCLNSEFALVESWTAALFGTNASEAQAERALRSLHGVASAFGRLLTLLIEAWLLRQFRDNTRWWWILGITAGLAVRLLYIPWAAIARPPTLGEAMGLQAVGYLIWAAMVWVLIRRWGWRDRYWFGFNIAVALVLLLVDRVYEVISRWARVLYAQVGVTDDTALHVLGELSAGLIRAMILAAPVAWFLWQYVIVHRRSVDAPAPGA
jgi:hypothetical protein